MQQCKAAGIVGRHCDQDDLVSYLVARKRGKLEVLGGKVEACDRGDAWTTGLREFREETNGVLQGVNAHMIRSVYAIPSAKYLVFVVDMDDAQRAIESSAYGTREIHDNVEREVIWITASELEHQVRVEHKARFHGLFDGLLPPQARVSAAASASAPLLAGCHLQQNKGLLPRLFDGVPFLHMCEQLFREWNVMVDHAWPHGGPLFCVYHKSDMRIWQSSGADNKVMQQMRLDFLAQNRGTIYEAACDGNGRMSYRVVAMGLEKFWRHDSPQQVANGAADRVWGTRPTTTVVVQTKYDGFNFKVYWYRNRWMVSTNSSVDASRVILRNSSKNALEAFWEAARVSHLDLMRMDRDHTYVFEMMHPHSRLVVPYERAALVHLSTRNNVTLCELGMGDGGSATATEHLASMAATRASDSAYDHSSCVVASDLVPFWQGEGFVAMATQRVDGEISLRRCKYKSRSYAQEHRLLLETHVEPHIKRAEYVVDKWIARDDAIVQRFHTHTLWPPLLQLDGWVSTLMDTFHKLMQNPETSSARGFHTWLARQARRRDRPLLRHVFALHTSAAALPCDKPPDLRCINNRAYLLDAVLCMQRMPNTVV